MEGKLTILEFRGHEGKTYFGNSEDQGGGEGGGDKIWKPSMVWL